MCTQITKIPAGICKVLEKKNASIRKESGRDSRSQPLKVWRPGRQGAGGCAGQGIHVGKHRVQCGDVHGVTFCP